ncbi:MAG: hypothetical protein C5B56_03085 [Proteobacteria bacterium]|nr:MAG: hypothetical protein C5B56_03085 [Pseudomonadota bacterium]
MISCGTVDDHFDVAPIRPLICSGEHGANIPEQKAQVPWGPLPGADANDRIRGAKLVTAKLDRRLAPSWHAPDGIRIKPKNSIARVCPSSMTPAP